MTPRARAALGMPGEGTRRGQEQLPQMAPFLGGCSCVWRWHCLDIHRLSPSRASSSICPSTALLPNSWEPQCWKSIWIAHRFPWTVIIVISSISFRHVWWTSFAEFSNVCWTFSAPWLISITTELPSHFGIISWKRKKPASRRLKQRVLRLSKFSPECAVNKFFQKNLAQPQVFLWNAPGLKC